jgi:hypothetical protein
MGCSYSLFRDIYQEALQVLVVKKEEKGEAVMYPERYLAKICMVQWIREKKRRERYVAVDMPDRVEDAGTVDISVILTPNSAILTPPSGFKSKNRYELTLFPFSS